MSFFVTYGKEIVSGAISIGGWLIKRGFQPRVRLTWGVSHSFSFLLNQPFRDLQGVEFPTTMAHTGTFVVKNEGTVAANNVELIFNYKPQHMNLWPARLFTVKTDPNERYVVCLENLAPKEVLTLEALAVQPFEVPVLFGVRSAQAVGTHVKLAPYKVIAPWLGRLIMLLALFGATAVIYCALALVQFLVLKTPT